MMDDALTTTLLSAAGKTETEKVKLTAVSSRSGESKELKKAEEGSKSSALGYHWYFDAKPRQEYIESTLLTKHGRFLVHADSGGCSYELLVNFRQEIKSVEIKQRNGGFCTCINGKDGKLFSSLKKLIKHHRGLNGRAIKFRDGSNVILVKSKFRISSTESQHATGCEEEKEVEEECDFKKKPWYFGGSLTEQEARSKMEQARKKEDGTYLVYDNPSREGSYVMLVYYKGEIKKMEINRVARFFYVLGEDGPGVNTHKDIKELIKHHRGVLGKPIQLDDGNKVILFDYIKS